MCILYSVEDAVTRETGIQMKHFFIKMFEEVWDAGLMNRPDPLGYCIMMMDMYNVIRVSKMSVIERQREKGYMK